MNPRDDSISQSASPKTDRESRSFDAAKPQVLEHGDHVLGNGESVGREKKYFQLRRVKVPGESTKWIQIPCESKEKKASYEEVILAVKDKFQLNEPLVIEDDDGAIIDDIVFDCFPLAVLHISEKAKLREVDFRNDELTSESSLATTVTVSEAPSLTSVTHEPGTSRISAENVNLLKVIKSTPGGLEILEEYEKTKTLNAQTRRKLVNVVVNSLVDRFGAHPSTAEKVAYAQSIILTFPTLKDPGSTEGYEAFYDPATRSGYISWRLRTINRNQRHDLKLSKKLKTEDKEPEKTTTPSEELPILSDEEYAERMLFLKHACPKTQKDEIKSAMKLTFVKRRTTPENILEHYPKFVCTSYLINYEFSLLHPTIKLENFSHHNIFKAASLHIARKNDVQQDEEADWDPHTRGFITLLRMLPPTAKGRKRTDRDKISSAIDKLILFLKLGTPLENANVKTKQPCLLAVGANRGAISSYFIAVDGQYLPTDGQTSLEAFDQLFKTHSVLNTKFDDNLLSFYQFIQVFYYKLNVDEVKFTPRMREVRTWLTHCSGS